MARTLALCFLLGVVGIVCAGSYGSNPPPKCAYKKYNVEGNVNDPFLSATDANGKNSGFIIDVLELFKSYSNGTFDYKLTAGAVPVASYESLVNDLVNKKFDMVAADLTVRSDRIDRIDFLVSYLRSQVRILTNNNPTSDSNFANAVVGYNPTWYVEDDANVIGYLQSTTNATLQAAYQSAVAGNRVVDINTGDDAVRSSNSPAALIATTPKLYILNGESTATGLTSDILETHRFAFAIQKGQAAQLLCLNRLQLLLQEKGSIQDLLNKYGLN